MERAEEQPDTRGTSVHVFISYSHESKAHDDWVLALANKLTEDGIHCIYDRYVDGSPPEGWPMWRDRGIQDADFVLVICTETYCRKTMETGRQDSAKSERWESMLTYQHLHDEDGIRARFIPILPPDAETTAIPLPLRGFNQYRIAAPEDYLKLYRHLSGQPAVVRPPKGQMNHLPVDSGNPVLFPQDRQGEEPAAAEGNAATSGGPKRLSRHRQWVLLMIPIILILAVVLSQMNPRESEPVFHFKKQLPFFQMGEVIIVRAGNPAASSEAPLNIRLNDRELIGFGEPVPDSDPTAWSFYIGDPRIPAAIREEKDFDIAFSLPGGAWSPVKKIHVSSEAPSADVSITRDGADIQVSGAAGSGFESDQEHLEVKAIFYHDGISTEYPLTPEKNGSVYNFHHTIRGIPQLKEDDPGYREPFFEFVVTDGAKNLARTTMNYAHFMADSNLQFTVGHTEIKFGTDMGQAVDQASFQIHVAPVSTMADGRPPLNLTVTAYTLKVISNLPEGTLPDQPLTLVYRNGKQVDSVFGNTYEDTTPAEKDVTYRVAQDGRDGKRYLRNAVTVPKEPFELAGPTVPLRVLAVDQNVVATWRRNGEGPVYKLAFLKPYYVTDTGHNFYEIYAQDDLSGVPAYVSKERIGFFPWRNQRSFESSARPPRKKPR